MTKISDSKPAASRLDILRNGPQPTPAIRGRLVVSIERLIEDPRNERRSFDGLDGLVESIRAVGLVEPLTVTPTEDGRYQILTGHRRFRAARSLELKQLEVIVRDPVDEAIRRRRSVVSNVQREDIPVMELAEALQEMLEDDPAIPGQKQLAAVIGKSPQWVSDMLRVLTLPKALQTKLRAAARPISADSVAKIARLNDPAQQAELVTQMLRGATTREVRAALSAKTALKARKSPPRRVTHTVEGGVTVILQSRSLALTKALQISALNALLRKLGEN